MNQGENVPQNKHFMQDAIERRIEKFSSQNANNQKRVNTSGKFRNNNQMILGQLPGQVSATHGPGTSGGQGSHGLGPIKKKFSLGGDDDIQQDLAMKS